MRTDEELVLAARAGEPDAFGSLVGRWTGRCWDIAWRILHDRDLAADVAQETLLTAWQQLDRLEQPASFGGWVSRIARNRALDRLERERRAVPTGDHEALEVYAERSVVGAGAAARSGGDPVAALDSSQQQELVWAAAAALGERDASVLDLHLRHGLEPRELAAELGIEPNNAHQVLFRLRQRLGGAIRAWLLWRGGRPRCERLEADLAAADVEVFGAAAVAVIDDHASGCLACDRDRTAVVAPAAMFSAVPMALMPAALGARVLSGLEAAGVPVPAGGMGVEVAAEGAEAAGGGLAGEPAGRGDAASADSTMAGGEPAATGGEHAGSEADAGAGADAGGGADPGHGADAAADAGAGGGDEGGAAVPAKALVGAIGGAVAIVIVVLLALAFGAGGPPDQDELVVAPVPDPPTDPIEPPQPPEPEDTNEIAPLPPVPGGQDDPNVVPDVPPGPWHRLADLDGPDDSAGAPEQDAPEVSQPPPPPPPAPDDGNGNGDDGNGNDDDGNGNGGEAPEPAPAITRLEARVVSFGDWCQGDVEGMPIVVSWATSDATTVTLRTDLQTHTGLGASGDRQMCSGWDTPHTVTLQAEGPGGSASRTETAAI